MFSHLKNCCRNNLSIALTVATSVLLALSVGCNKSQPDESIANFPQQEKQTNQQTKIPFKGPAGDDGKRVSKEHSFENLESENLESGSVGQKYPAIQNLIAVNDKIYSGGEPSSEEAFANLVELGVKTIVSVDGATPDVETARKYGLRYIHVPIGYDGVEKSAGLSFARIVREVDGPFFVHCHHGQHRAPAAAAIACVASGDLDGKTALKILERAGTGKAYTGLWRDVENYQVPTDDIELPELVEIAEVESLAVAMARIGRSFDILMRFRQANWVSLVDHPDLVPDQEALLLKEGIRESTRNLADEFNHEFKEWLRDSETLAQDLEDSLRSQKSPDEFNRKLKLLGHSCKQCHEKYRN